MNTAKDYKLNILVAYPYAKPKLLESMQRKQNDIRFLLDSGAFSAWKSKRVIKLEDYCEFVQNVNPKPWRYFALDVIGNPEATKNNYLQMLKMGLKPIPVFTKSQPFSDIDWYYQTTDVMGCGGLTTKFGKEAIVYLDRVHKHANGRRIHMLGYTKPDYIKRYKPYSCDSTSWDRAKRFGSMDVYVGHGKFIQWRRMQAMHPPKEELLRALVDMQVDISRFKKNAEWRDHTNDSLPRIISARSWVKFSIDCQQRLNTKLFFAINGHQELEILHRQFLFWRGEK